MVAAISHVIAYPFDRLLPTLAFHTNLNIGSGDGVKVENGAIATMLDAIFQTNLNLLNAP